MRVHGHVDACYCSIDDGAYAHISCCSPGDKWDKAEQDVPFLSSMVTLSLFSFIRKRTSFMAGETWFENDLVNCGEVSSGRR